MKYTCLKIIVDAQHVFAPPPMVMQVGAICPLEWFFINNSWWELALLIQKNQDWWMEGWRPNLVLLTPTICCGYMDPKKSKQETRSYNHHTMIDNAMYHQKSNETFFLLGKNEKSDFLGFFDKKQTFLRESRPYFHNFEKKVRYLTKAAIIRPSWRHWSELSGHHSL